MQVQGGGEEEREDKRKKRKIVAPAAESTNTGTEITTPFGDEDDARAMVMLPCFEILGKNREITYY